MNKSATLDLILNRYNQLNKAEQKIARIVQKNPEPIVKMTIKELAELGKVSETTVFRFCDKLGYSGFAEFKINLALGLFDSEQELHSDISKEDDSYLIAQKLLASNVNSAKKTIDVLDFECIDEISAQLVKAHSLYFFGMGGSYSMADDARHKFVRLNPRSFAEADLHWQTILISTAQEGDVCFLFSNSGSNKDLIELLPLLKEKGVLCIGVTGSESSPLSEKVDFHLRTYEEGARFVTEAMESRQNTMLLIDILFVRASLYDMDTVEKNLLDIRKGIAKRRI